MAGLDGGVGFLSLLVIALIPLVSVTGSNSTDNIQESVEWVTSEFGACSVACGGGLRVRIVRCVRTWKNSERDYETKMPASSCPTPSPQMTQSCNNHVCVGHWTKGKWSECSVTCGTGIQSRDVKCESTQDGQRSQVAPADCGGSAPETSRKCHVTDCPLGEKMEPHSILSENYTLIQLRRTKKIKVNIGGQVNLLPGQTVVVKCPVKHYSKKLIYWSKGYKLVPFMGRVRSTPGGLYIGRADPSADAGVYTCIAGELTAPIAVQFIMKNDSLAKMYKKWMKEQYQKYSQPRNGKGNQKLDVLIGQGNPDELNQQRDQSQNFSHSLMYVTGDWSECSAVTCGSEGFKKRKVSCCHVTPQYVKIVPDLECLRAAIDKPEASEECSAGERCAGWHSGPWSKCIASCGQKGHMNRLLTCVWQSTGQPALGACDLKNRPAVSKPCNARPCSVECTDSSRYCNLTRLLRMCRFHQFRRQCCLTCQTLAGSVIT